MNGATLAALRRLLLFSVPEAARWVPVASDRPQGVEERTWNRWEAGRQPVPPNVAARMRELVAWADQAEAAGLATLAERAGDQPCDVALIWYAEADDFDGPAVMWRPQCAVVARLAARFDGIELVTFDAQAYQRWRQASELPDNSATRSAWAAEQRGNDHDDTR